MLVIELLTQQERELQKESENKIQQFGVYKLQLYVYSKIYTQISKIKC